MLSEVAVEEGEVSFIAKREAEVEETPKRRKDSAICLKGQKGGRMMRVVEL